MFKKKDCGDNKTCSQNSSDSDSSFRFLGIKVFEKCDKNIKKCLVENQLYLLCDDYEEKSCNIYNLNKIVQVDNNSNLHIYDVKGEKGKVTINVSAIVGKNGDGKSSMLEVILRVINNFACVYGYQSDHELLWIEGLRAAIYYEVNGVCYSIVSEGDHGTIGWYKEGKLIEGFSELTDDKEKKKFLNEHHADDLFYTLVVNFSLYAYNPEMLAGENQGDECWVDNLFHKNDSYQTPIVLNPMREEDGTIDVINEMDLSRQRLLSIYSMGSSDKQHEVYRVNKDKYAVGYAFKLIKENTKFEEKTLRNYCVYHVSDFYHWSMIDSLESDNIADAGLAKRNLVLNFLNYWDRCKQIIDQHKGVLRYMEVSTRKKRETIGSNSTDLGDYLGIIHKWMGNSDIVLQNKEIVRGTIEYVIKNHGNWLNYSMLYRLVLLVETWETMKELYPATFNCTMEEAFTKQSDPKKAACLYVVYKITSITEKYNPYKGQSYHSDANYELLINHPGNHLPFTRLREDIKELLKKNDYRTMKMHQALNYLLYQPHNYYQACRLLNDKDVYTHMLTFQTLREQIKSMNGYNTVRDAGYFLPPAIFDGDIVVENKDNRQFRLSSLSSGELQLLNSVGSVIYHLRNLDDHTYKENIQYKNINIILEEVELYFHPEFQKQYIAYLLRQIEYLKLRNIRCLNIIVVTHSPFVLSDVMRTNTLYLSSGEISDCLSTQTFGANLYDLMADSFFLDDNTIGNVAGKYVNHLVDRIENKETINDVEIDIIGDSILRGYLYELRDNPQLIEDE